MAPINSSQLTTVIQSSVTASFIYNDTKYSVPVITITEFDCTKYTPPPPQNQQLQAEDTYLTGMLAMY